MAGLLSRPLVTLLLHIACLIVIFFLISINASKHSHKTFPKFNKFCLGVLLVFYSTSAFGVYSRTSPLGMFEKFLLIFSLNSFRTN